MCRVRQPIPSGIIYRVWAHADSTGPATININSLGAKQLVSAKGEALTAGQIKAGDVLSFVYDGTNFKLISAQTHDAKFTGSTAFTGPVSVASNAASRSIVLKPEDAGIEIFSTAGGYIDFKNGESEDFDVRIQQDGQKRININASEGVYINGNTAWHAGNDGSGSGLDSDFLRGAQPMVAGGSSTIVQRRSDGSILGNSLITDGSANGGTVYLGSNGLHYLNYDGANYNLANGGLSVSGSITTHSGYAYINGSGNTHLWFQNNGVNRAVSYFDVANDTFQQNLNDTNGNYTRAFTYRRSDGRFYVAGYMQTSGGVITNSGRVTGGDGNGNMIVASDRNGAGVYLRPNGEGSSVAELISSNNGATWNGHQLVRQDGGNWAINITGTAGYLRQGGTGNGMTFHWSGQGGQPTWLWGGSDGVNHYVYNPSNFSVNYANSANNSNYLGGVAWSSFAQYSGSQNVNETNFPRGTKLVAHFGNAQLNRRAPCNVWLHNGNAYMYTINQTGSLVGGTWVGCGFISSNNGNFYLVEKID